MKITKKDLVRITKEETSNWYKGYPRGHGHAAANAKAQEASAGYVERRYRP